MDLSVNVDAGPEQDELRIRSLIGKIRLADFIIHSIGPRGKPVYTQLSPLLKPEMLPEI